MSEQWGGGGGGDTDWSAAGFLNTNPSPMTKGSVSNYGLVDQMAALQWVGENVEQFGGDKGRITLMGQVGGEIYRRSHTDKATQAPCRRWIFTSCPQPVSIPV